MFLAAMLQIELSNKETNTSLSRYKVYMITVTTAHQSTWHWFKSVLAEMFKFLYLNADIRDQSKTGHAVWTHQNSLLTFRSFPFHSFLPVLEWILLRAWLSIRTSHIRSNLGGNTYKIHCDTEVFFQYGLFEHFSSCFHFYGAQITSVLLWLHIFLSTDKVTVSTHILLLTDITSWNTAPIEYWAVTILLFI